MVPFKGQRRASIDLPFLEVWLRQAAYSETETRGARCYFRHFLRTAAAQFGIEFQAEKEEALWALLRAKRGGRSTLCAQGDGTSLTELILLRARDVTAWYAEFLAAGPAANAARIGVSLTVLRSFYQWAQLSGLCSLKPGDIKNPLAQFHQPQRIGRKALRRTAATRRKFAGIGRHML